MSTKEIVCTVCPNSCSVTVELSEKGEPVHTQGNRCPRGKTFALQEVVCPVRVLTSTVLLIQEDGEEVLFPVRSSAAFALSKHTQAMELLRRIRINAPVRMGDVLIRNLLETNVDIVASCNS